METKLIVGLGNPGSQYETTRHNVGFLAVDHFIQNASTNPNQVRKKVDGLSCIYICDGLIPTHKVMIQKPLTFMNRSGQAVAPIVTFYKVSPSHLLVIHDDLDIPFGSVRLKIGGGHGGHNGLKSLDSSLGFNTYLRVRVGIGRPSHPGQDVSNYVLDSWNSQEKKALDAVFTKTSQAMEAFLKDDFMLAMNALNRRDP